MFFLTFDEEQNHARSKVPKFDYFDSKMFNFSSLFLIKFVRQNKGRYFDMTRNENVFLFFLFFLLERGALQYVIKPFLYCDLFKASARAIRIDVNGFLM